MVLPPPSLSAAAEPGAVPSALAEDDECLAGDERCSLNALQLRGQMEAGARATMHSALRGLFKDLGHMVRTQGDQQAGETCMEAAQALGGCMPKSITDGANSTKEPTVEDLNALCSCESHVKAMTQTTCPAEVKQMAEQLLPMMGAMCSDCGVASAKVTLNADCTVEAADGNKTLDVSSACGSVCHPRICGMLKACPPGFKVEGLPAHAADAISHGTAEARAAVKSCACSA